MILLEGVTKNFDRGVLFGVDLQVEKGSLYGLVGPGAAGKSVVLKIVAGLIPVNGGSVVVEDREITTFTEPELTEYRSRIGMVFQNNALFDFMTVAENVAFPLRRLLHLSEAEVDARVQERLERVGLGGFGPRSPAGLSGGQKKRVGVARATVTRAPIVLYDEPAAGLDPVTSQRIFDLLREEQRHDGSTVIMISSDVDRLLTVTDRVGMMHEGVVVFEGSPAEARSTDDPLVHQFFTGGADGPL